MLARVELPVGQAKKMLMAPKDAVVLNANKRTVFVVDPDSKVVSEVAVELGVSNGDLIEVSGALKAGQQVVIRGNERLRSGQSVSIASNASDPAEDN